MVTCKFSIDRQVDAVLYNGRNVTTSVAGDLSDLRVSKSFTFQVVPGGSLVIIGHGARDAGLWLACTSEDDAFWAGAASSVEWNNHWAWRATALEPWSPGSEPVPPRALSDAATWDHPVAHRNTGFDCDACGTSSEGSRPTRIWLPGTRYTAFAILPPPPIAPAHEPFAAGGCRYYVRPLHGANNDERRLVVHEFRVADGALYRRAHAGVPPMALYSDDEGLVEESDAAAASGGGGGGSMRVHDAPFGRADGSDSHNASWWHPLSGTPLACPATLAEAYAVDASSPPEHQWMSHCNKTGVWCGTYIATCADESCGEMTCAPAEEEGALDLASGSEHAVGSGDAPPPPPILPWSSSNATCTSWPRHIQPMRYHSTAVDAVTHAAAVSACALDGNTTLAEPRSLSMHRRLSAYAQANATDLWLGLIWSPPEEYDAELYFEYDAAVSTYNSPGRTPHVDAAWRWVSDGSRIMAASAQWADEEASAMGGGGPTDEPRCAFLSASDGRWHVASCGDRHGYACSGRASPVFISDDEATHGPAHGLTCPAPRLASISAYTTGPGGGGGAGPRQPPTSTGLVTLIFVCSFVVSICCIQCTGCFSDMSGLAPAQAVAGHANWRQLGGDEVSYLRSPNACICGEVPRFLLTDATSGCSMRWTAKWQIMGRVGVLEIGLHRDVMLRRYRLRSADCKPTRDPRAWSLYGVDETGGLHLLHRHRQRGSPWACDRWAWRDFEIARPDAKFRKFRLQLEANNGDIKTHLGQLALIEEMRPDADVEMADMGATDEWSSRTMQAARARPVAEMVPVPTVHGLCMDRDNEEQAALALAAGVVQAGQSVLMYGVAVDVAQSDQAVDVAQSDTVFVLPQPPVARVATGDDGGEVVYAGGAADSGEAAGVPAEGRAMAGIAAAAAAEEEMQVVDLHEDPSETLADVAAPAQQQHVSAVVGTRVRVEEEEEEWV